jgi:transposase
VDSSKLSRELANGSLEGIYVPDTFHEQLRALGRLYWREVRHLSRLKNRIRGHLYCQGIRVPDRSELYPWSGRFLSWLEDVEFTQMPGKDFLCECIEELKDTKMRIHSILRKLRAYSQNEPTKRIVWDYLMSIPGVGFITAMFFYMEIIDIHRFSNFDHLASYVGLVPDTRASGDREITMGMTFRQNRYLKHLLIEASWIAVRRDPALTVAFGELVKRMGKQKAIIRIAKKLLRRMRHVWMTEQRYIAGIVE